MDRLKLVQPDERHEAMLLDYRQEHFEAGERSLQGGNSLHMEESYAEWLARMGVSRGPEGPDVPSTTFLAVRESDGVMVGIITLRHELNDFLLRCGGHIGYGVRPSERRKGYASEMLRQVLVYAREELGLQRVLLGCEQANTASRRVIEGAGGVFERMAQHGDMNIRMYWIEL